MRTLDNKEMAKAGGGMFAPNSWWWPPLLRPPMRVVVENPQLTLLRRLQRMPRFY